MILEEDAAAAAAKSDSCVRTSLQRITQTQRGRARHPQHFHRLHARAWFDRARCPCFECTLAYRTESPNCSLRYRTHCGLHCRMEYI